ncbi:cytochrome P450 26A1-like, partial [Lingula anatina]|uniref:Cytochrome P450 26A1-like n=1 Tax=Lingula anatina TaxID=7574 RepID=A0A2R2MLY7_LINAN
VLLLYLACKLWQMYVLSTTDQTSKLPLPPGSMGWPIIGESLNFISKPTAFYNDRRTKYGRVYKTHLLGQPTIRVIGAENVQKILTHEDELVTHRWPSSTRTIMGENGVIHSGGAEHNSRRIAIAKAFQHSALSTYVPEMQETVHNFIRTWCDKGRILGYPECRTLAFSITSKVLLGCDFTQSKDVEEALANFEDNLFSFPVNIPGSGLHKGIKARNFLLTKIDECISRHKSGSQSYPSALGLLLSQSPQGSLSQTELRNIALELLFAGHQTTASAACCLMMHLGKKTEVVDRIAEELYDRHLFQEANFNTQLNLDAISELRYLSQVVREVLRINPPVGGGFRKVLKTFDVDGMQVPKGWTVTYSIRDTHETTNFFQQRDKFDPDRWNAIQGDSQEVKYNYLPFGAGARGCLGKEFAKLILKILAIELVRNCSWRLLNASPEMKYLPVAYPTDNLPIEFSSAPRPLRPRALTL